jgi:hypothetical protein
MATLDAFIKRKPAPEGEATDSGDKPAAPAPIAPPTAAGSPPPGSPPPPTDGDANMQVRRMMGRRYRVGRALPWGWAETNAMQRAGRGGCLGPLLTPTPILINP